MKKVYAITIVFALLILGACGTGGGTSSDTVKLRLAGQSPKDHPSTEALEAFAEKVNEESDGRIEITVYPANQLGDYTTVFEEVGAGTIDMALIGLPGDLDRRLEVIFLPYFVNSYDNIEQHYDKSSFLFNKLNEVTSELGISLIGFHANGFGGLGTTKEIQNLLDFNADKGLLLRTAPMQIYQQPMKDIGFRTTTIPFADLYTALQTGAADGWSGGEASLNYFGYRDVIKYFYKTNDFFNIDSFLMNENKFNSLDDDLKEIISQAADELTANSFETAESYDNEYIDLMEEEGIEVIELSEEELNNLAKHVRETTWPILDNYLGDGIVEDLKKELE